MRKRFERVCLFSTPALNLLLPSVFIDYLQVTQVARSHETSVVWVPNEVEYGVFQSGIEPFSSWIYPLLPSQSVLDHIGAIFPRQLMIKKGSSKHDFFIFCEDMVVRFILSSFAWSVWVQICSITWFFFVCLSIWNQVLHLGYLVVFSSQSACIHKLICMHWN